MKANDQKRHSIAARSSLSGYSPEEAKATVRYAVVDKRLITAGQKISEEKIKASSKGTQVKS